MSEDIQFIVQSLNKPPFNMRLSMVTLDGKTGMELLEVVHTVFGHLDDSFDRKSAMLEDKEVLATNMLEFVVILKYKSAEEIEAFSPKFLAADKAVVYPFLAWMLSRLDELKKRAYIAKFLRPAQLPDDLFADEQVVQLVQQLRVAQEEFKVVHKDVEVSREKQLPLNDLEKDITQLESELDQLENKIQKLHTRVETGPEFHAVDFDAIQNATHTLRKEQEEETNLSRQLREQRQKVEACLYHRRVVTNNLGTLQENQKQHSAAQLQQQKKDQVSQQLKKNEELEKMLRERSKVLREVAKTLTTSPLSQDMVEQQQYECESLAQQIRMLAAQRDADCDNNDQVGFCRKRLSGLEEKLSKQTDRYGELDDEKTMLEEDIQRIDVELKAIIGDGAVMTDSQLAVYAQNLKVKMETLKTLKAQLKASQNETAILQHTEEVLRSRDSKLEEIVHELERDKGIVGYGDMVAELEKLGLKAGNVNTDKGATLDQITKMIELINTTIKSKRATLQPLIQKLKQVRQEYDLIEMDYNKKNKQYESVAGVLRNEREKIIEEITKLQQDISADETSLHQLKSQDTILVSRLEIGQQEDMYVLARGRLNREYRTHQDRLEKVLDDEARKAKTLQEEQKRVMMSHQSHIGQRKLFTQLKSLLEAKKNATTKILDTKRREVEEGVIQK